MTLPSTSLDTSSPTNEPCAAGRLQACDDVPPHVALDPSAPVEPTVTPCRVDAMNGATTSHQSEQHGMQQGQDMIQQPQESCLGVTASILSSETSNAMKRGVIGAPDGHDPSHGGNDPSSVAPSPPSSPSSSSSVPALHQTAQPQANMHQQKKGSDHTVRAECPSPTAVPRRHAHDERVTETADASTCTIARLNAQVAVMLDRLQEEAVDLAEVNDDILDLQASILACSGPEHRQRVANELVEWERLATSACVTSLRYGMAPDRSATTDTVDRMDTIA